MVYKSQVWLLKPGSEGGEGDITTEDFQLNTENLREINDGEIICEAEYIAARKSSGAQKAAFQVAKVVESKNTAYPIGTYVYGELGWRTHTVVSNFESIYASPELGSISRSYLLSSLGHPGIAAYFGLKDICQISSGKVIAISEADSVIGALAAQISKIEGLTVVGMARGEENCQWLRDELGVNETINYENSLDIAEELKVKAPEGIDYYFDNAGGLVSYHVINHMNNLGRIAVCDSIYFNDSTLPTVPQITNFHRKLLTMVGFRAERWRDTSKWSEGVSQIRKWIEGNELKTVETIVNGFDKLPTAATESKANAGVTIIKV